MHWANLPHPARLAVARHLNETSRSSLALASRNALNMVRYARERPQSRWMQFRRNRPNVGSNRLDFLATVFKLAREAARVMYSPTREFTRASQQFIRKYRLANLPGLGRTFWVAQNPLTHINILDIWTRSRGAERKQVRFTAYHPRQGSFRVAIAQTGMNRRVSVEVYNFSTQRVAADIARVVGDAVADAATERGQTPPTPRLTAQPVEH